MEVQQLSEAFLARIEAKVEETRRHGGIPASRDEVQSLLASHRALSAALAQAEAEREALREVLAEARGWIARVSPTVLSPLARILDRAQETDEQWAARMVRYVNDRCAAALPAPPSPPAGEEWPKPWEVADNGDGTFRIRQFTDPESSLTVMYALPRHEAQQEADRLNARERAADAQGEGADAVC